MASVLSAKHYHDEDAAFAYVERHVWPNGPTCPHCGGVERISKMAGKETRKGLHKCYQCRKQFTVRQGTIFESSHVPLHIWLQAIFFVAGSKKGISSNQLHRTLGVTVKTAWFMAHRVREAMRSGDLAPFGGEGGVVEVDETYIGNRPGVEKRAGGGWHKCRFLRWCIAKAAMPVRLSLIVRTRKASSRSSRRTSTAKPTSSPMKQRSIATTSATIISATVASITRPVSMCAAHPHEHRRGLFLDLQARHEGRLSMVLGKAPSPLPCRI